MNRLTDVAQKNGSFLKIIYLSKNKLKGEYYPYYKRDYVQSWTTFNKKGQVVKSISEFFRTTHEFRYNKKGEMIREKSRFQNRKPEYIFYEYVK